MRRIWIWLRVRLCEWKGGAYAEKMEVIAGVEYNIGFLMWPDGSIEPLWMVPAESIWDEMTV